MALLTPLSANDRQALLAAKNAPATHLRERERIEMVLLADAGWTNAQIARHLDRSDTTVQAQVRRWAKEGLAGLEMRFSPGRPPRVTDAFKAKLVEKLKSERLYSARQLCAELEQETGIAITIDHMRAVVRGVGGRYKRTKKCVKHSRKPHIFEAKKEALEVLKKR